jgi:hypothetical protein
MQSQSADQSTRNRPGKTERAAASESERKDDDKREDP